MQSPSPDSKKQPSYLELLWSATPVILPGALMIGVSADPGIRLAGGILIVMSPGIHFFSCEVCKADFREAMRRLTVSRKGREDERQLP